MQVFFKITKQKHESNILKTTLGYTIAIQSEKEKQTVSKFAETNEKIAEKVAEGYICKNDKEITIQYCHENKNPLYFKSVMGF